MEYPEHEKLKRVAEESQAIGDFMAWLGEQGLELARHHEHGDGCPAWCLRGDRGLALDPHRRPIEEILADYYGIDLKALEREKRAMLDSLRADQAGR